MVSSGLFCRVLVGRADELAHLSARVGRSGRRSALLAIRGEAGVGKSRLVRELTQRAAASGTRTVTATVREFANAPYRVIVEALGALGASTTIERESSGEVDGDEKLRRFSEVATAFAEFGGGGAGLLVAIEDLHWADAGTVELLRFLARRLVDERVTLVATSRVAAETEPSRLRALAALERDAEDVLALAPLGDAEIDEMVRITLADAGRSLPGAVRERVRELAEGRPLFAEELLRGALERRDREGPLVTVPDDVQVTVRERFATLGERDRELLLQAAVVGRRFSADFVRRLTGASAAQVFAALRRARDLQLVVEENDERGDRFAFRHALTREAIYSQLLRAETFALHARVAKVLGEENPLDVPAIAEHAWRARDVEHGIGWNERAGDLALGVFAYADAARHYLRASEIATDPGQRALLAEQSAEALYANGDVGGAVERLSEAIGALAVGPERTRLALRKTYLLSDQGRYEESLREALEAVEQLREEDSPTRFNAETMTAGLLSVRGRPAEALDHLERADRLAARTDPGSSIARFEGIYAFTLGVVGRAEEARARFARACAAARERRDDDVLVRSLNNHGNVELAYGTVGEARRLYDEGLEVARATKNLRFVAWVSQNATLGALLAGDAAAAARHHEVAAAIRHDVDSVRLWMLATTLRRSTLAGADDENLREEALAASRATQLVRDAPALSALTGALALASLRHGRDDEARELVASAAGLAAEAEVPYWLHDAVARCGEVALRAAARAALARIAERDGARSARGALAAAQAREAIRSRRRNEAVAAAERAVTAFREAGWRIDEAFALELAGRTAEAVALFRSCGALGEVRRLTETRSRARRRGEATLTEREREIAALVAAGHATRAVAESLVISERTVETHIASVYRKLGVASRGELAALLGAAAPQSP